MSKEILIGSSRSIGDGITTVTSAGTAVRITTHSTKCRRVWVQALDNNTGTIVVGSASVVATQATRRGKALASGQGDWFYVADVSMLYFDATADSQKFTYYIEY